MYTADNRFYQAFRNNADIARTLDSDQQVKSAVIAEINSDTDLPSDVILVEFNGVQKAGAADAFMMVRVILQRL